MIDILPLKLFCQSHPCFGGPFPVLSCLSSSCVAFDWLPVSLKLVSLIPYLLGFFRALLSVPFIGFSFPVFLLIFVFTGHCWFNLSSQCSLCLILCMLPLTPIHWWLQNHACSPDLHVAHSTVFSSYLLHRFQFYRYSNTVFQLIKHCLSSKSVSLPAFIILVNAYVLVVLINIPSSELPTWETWETLHTCFFALTSQLMVTKSHGFSLHSLSLLHPHCCSVRWEPHGLSQPWRTSLQFLLHSGSSLDYFPLQV